MATSRLGDVLNFHLQGYYKNLRGKTFNQLAWQELEPAGVAVQWWLESHAQWRSSHHLVRRASSSGVASCRVSRAPSRSGWARNLNELAPALRPRAGPGRVTGSALPGRNAGPCWAPAVGACGQSPPRRGTLRRWHLRLRPRLALAVRQPAQGRWPQRAWLGGASASGLY